MRFILTTLAIMASFAGALAAPVEATALSVDSDEANYDKYSKITSKDGKTLNHDKSVEYKDKHDGNTKGYNYEKNKVHNDNKVYNKDSYKSKQYEHKYDEHKNAEKEKTHKYDEKKIYNEKHNKGY